MEKLYMLEVFVNEIIFEELPVPLKKDIIINVACPNVGSLEIRTNVMGALENLDTKERSAKKKDVDIDCGRSMLFPKEPRKMRDIVKRESLEVVVYTTNEVDPIGSVHIPWSNYFDEMVESSMETSGYLTPVIVQNQYELMKNGKITANVSMLIGLSFLGRTVYTNIQKIASKIDTGAPEGVPGAYLFKSVDNATIFKCERHGAGSDHDVMPVAAIYNLSTFQTPRAQQMKKATKSTETLLAFNNLGSTTSVRRSAFFGMSTADMSSMVQRVLSTASTSTWLPKPLRGQNYLDLTDLRMDASTFSMLAAAMGMHVYRNSNIECEGEAEGENQFQPMFVDYKSLTVAEIEARLCKHPDCPAAKKFKEFGIGPLAKNISGLGGMYNDVEAPCSYGLSHCNGTIDNYGPLGRFKRPKKAEDPFVPQSDCKCARKSSSTITTKSQGSNTSTRIKGKSACYSHCPMNPMKLSKHKPLRLRGGGPPVADCETLPNPFTLCQDLMDEYNKVLKDYKEALGPCGQPTCPFALSVVGDQCYEICNSSDPEYQKRVCNLTNPNATLEEKDEFTGCGVPYCPYKRAAISPAEKEFSKYKNMPGCGFTKCPFVKAKLGMEPDEDNHLPPFQDYQKQQTYKYTDALPPIHWDCPDPLPKGDCKNPDCPFVKRDALIKKYFPEPCCPCGSPACPYVCAPCAFPGCPFSIAEPCPPVCPYTEPPPKELRCTPSVCPFVRNTEKQCENINCPYRIYEEKMAECAQWERQQAILAEQEEEEEEVNEICKPCERGKSARARCSKSNQQEGASTSKLETLQTTSKTSGTNISSLPEKSSEPCILSGAVEKRDKQVGPCKPDTCGSGICGICKGVTTNSPKDEAKVISKSDITYTVSQGISSKSKVAIPTSIPKIPTQISKGVAPTTKVAKPSNLKQPATRPASKPAKTINARKGNKVMMMGPLGNPSATPGICRKLPFKFDKKSYKPCSKIGHRDCVLPKFLVPKCMGWLWNIHEDICGLRPRRGWKPGAVSKMLAFRMDYFNALREKRPFGVKDKEGELAIKPSQPTVQINKKAGVVNVTMLPVKDPVDVQKAGDGNPYLDCSPIQFKITKNNPEKQTKYCFCGDQLSDSDSSELDIEFSPPAALPNPRLMHKNPWSEEDVQYNINDVPLPPKKPKNTGDLWSNVILRLRGGGCDTTRNGNEISTQTVNVETNSQINRRQVFHPLPPVATSIWRRIISWRISEDCFNLRVLFLTVNVNFVEDISQIPVVNNDISEYFPVLRLRGGGRTPRLRGGADHHKARKPAKALLPDPREVCKDLMDDYDNLMVDYKKAIGPCGTAICPINYNVLEEKCKKVCQDKICLEPYCPPKLGPCMKPICPHIPSYSNVQEDYEDADEDEWKKIQACFASCIVEQPDGSPAKPCGRTVCPYGKSTPPEVCPPWECAQLEDCTLDSCITANEPVQKTNPRKDDIKCNKHICPYKADQLTVDDVNPFNRNKINPRKGCGSPFCPHSNKFQVEPEVVLPAFPCKRPCPSLEELPPIHWDCPDPLPQGECTNPFCPLREKLPCGHCPIDARHCGMPGCQFAGDSLCPPTCPYTQKKPPKDLECTPSVCPFVRPADYVKPCIIPRKDRPCRDQCPYATGSKKKSCGNPQCPYKTCIDNLSNAQKDCGSPCCPYRIADKKLEEKEKERAAKKELMEGTFIPLTDTSHVKIAATLGMVVDVAPQLKSVIPVTAAGDNNKENEDPASRKSTRKSAMNILKIIKSTAYVQDVNTSTGDVCKEITCAQFIGDRVCKKCLARQREAQAAGTDLITLEAKKKAAANTTSNSRKKKKSKKKKARGYVYDKGTYYPGIKFGHKDCGCGAKRVPWNMGWKWNITPTYAQLKTRAGWRPGAIGRTMLKFINKERKKLGLPPRPMIRDPLPRRRSMTGMDILTRIHRSRVRISHTHLCKPKPTLTVKKKDGVVYVTMNPLKDPATMEENEYPYVDCSPMEFKITKKKINNEFTKCLCSTDNPEGDALESDASSELDIEFTPPAGIVRPELMARNKHICHTEAQYDKNDFPQPPKNKKKGKNGKSKKGKGKKGKSKKGKGKKKGKK